MVPPSEESTRTHHGCAVTYVTVDGKVKWRAAGLRCGAMHWRSRVVPILLDPPQFERTGHNFKLRATVRAKDNLAFLNIVFLEVEAVLALGTQKFVPVRKSAGNPFHDYFSFPAGDTPTRVPCLRTHADPVQVVQILFYSSYLASGSPVLAI